MIIQVNSSCETKYDFEGHKSQLVGYNWKKRNFGLFKIWLGYEIYNLIDLKNKKLVLDEDGRILYGKNLEQIEIKWGWK